MSDVPERVSIVHSVIATEAANRWWTSLAVCVYTPETTKSQTDAGQVSFSCAFSFQAQPLETVSKIATRSVLEQAWREA